MKIFLTGHRGFLGSHLLDALSASNHIVETTERTITPELVNQMNFASFDGMVHLAATTPQSASSSSEGFTLDALITEALAIACVESRVRLIFASSSTVYRESQMLLGEESDVNADNGYANSKLLAENRILELHQTGDLDCCILRLFNPYGPRQGASYFIPYVIQQALRGAEINLKNPRNVRDYIYVNDATRAFMSAIEWTVGTREGADAPRIFNVGSGVGVSGLQLIETVERILNQKTNVRLPSEQKPYNSYVADCSRARDILGFERTTNFEDGLRSTISSFASLMN